LNGKSIKQGKHRIEEKNRLKAKGEREDFEENNYKNHDLG
jgi:hypothetical protein